MRLSHDILMGNEFNALILDASGRRVWGRRQWPAHSWPVRRRAASLIFDSAAHDLSFCSQKLGSWLGESEVLMPVSA
jgi:hypothetical protein